MCKSQTSHLYTKILITSVNANQPTIYTFTHKCIGDEPEHQQQYQIYSLNTTTNSAALAGEIERVNGMKEVGKIDKLEFAIRVDLLMVRLILV